MAGCKKLFRVPRTMALAMLSKKMFRVPRNPWRKCVPPTGITILYGQPVDERLPGAGRQLQQKCKRFSVLLVTARTKAGYFNQAFLIPNPSLKNVFCLVLF